MGFIPLPGEDQNERALIPRFSAGASGGAEVLKRAIDLPDKLWDLVGSHRVVADVGRAGVGGAPQADRR
jgi:hypothetical protein